MSVKRYFKKRTVGPVEVTVVTPNYNGAQYLERTIRSVMAQDYQPLQHIVVDDGSTDSSCEVANRFSDSVTLIEKENGGLPTAINAGFRRAKGDLVCWLDSDNLLLPGAVQEAAEAFAVRPTATIIYGDYLRIDENDKPIAARKQPSFEYNTTLYGYLTICNAGVFFNRRLLEACGFADEQVRCACDMDLYLKLGRIGDVIHLPKYLSAYRVRSDAMHVKQAAIEQEDVRNIRRRYGKPGVSDGKLQMLHLLYKARAGFRMLCEGVLWCRLWPLKYLHIPKSLPMGTFGDYLHVAKNG